MGGLSKPGRLPIGRIGPGSRSCSLSRLEVSVVPASPSGPDSGELGIFTAGGEAGRLMAALDWSKTPVGPV